MTAIHFSAAPASRTRSSSSAWVMAATHEVFSTNQAISEATERVLVVTATAPTVAQASQASTISGQLSACTSTLSPGETPRSPRPTARPSTSASSSA